MTNADKIGELYWDEQVELLLGNACNVCAGRGLKGCGTDRYCRQKVLEWLQKDYVDEDFQKLFCRMEFD